MLPTPKGWELFQNASNEVIWHSLMKASPKLSYINRSGKLFPIPAYIIDVTQRRLNLASNERVWVVVLAGWEKGNLGIYSTKEEALKIAIGYMRRNPKI